MNSELIKEITDEEAMMYMEEAEKNLMNGKVYGPMEPELQAAFDSIINERWDKMIEEHDYEIGTCGINIETTEGKAKVLIAFASVGGDLED